MEVADNASESPSLGEVYETFTSMQSSEEPQKNRVPPQLQHPFGVFWVYGLELCSAAMGVSTPFSHFYACKKRGAPRYGLFCTCPSVCRGMDLTDAENATVPSSLLLIGADLKAHYVCATITHRTSAGQGRNTLSQPHTLAGLTFA